MNNKKISVIIPVYNTEKYLSECIESVLNQTYKNFELLLIDDGSTDNSGKICDEYAEQDSRIKVIHKDNAGVSIARNTGIDNSNGEYICFIDSDDIIHETYLQVLTDNMMPDGMSAVEATHNLKHLGAGNGIDILNNQEAQISICTSTNGMYAYPVTRIFIKSIIEKYHIRFNGEILFLEDLIFNTQYLSKINGDVKFIHRCLYYYRPSVGVTYNRSSKKKKINSNKITEFKACQISLEYALNYPEVKFAYLMRGVKGACNDIRTMTANDYIDNNYFNECRKYMKKYGLKYLKSDNSRSSKVSVLLSLISPKLELFVWRLKNK